MEKIEVIAPTLNEKIREIICKESARSLSQKIRVFL